MSFRKRLTISFGIIIVVPVLLFAIAFQVLGSYMAGKTGINLFSMTDAAGLISGDFMSSLFLCMILILLFTALLLTRWLEKSFFGPISVLNKGMNHIRDGNLDFILKTDEEGEIGELYQNYEEMRLRLKESQEEKLLQEKQNRELLSNISHDLKTPITSIKGYVEGLIDGVANTPEKQDKYIRRINVGDYFGDCVEEIGMDLESRGIELNYSNLIAPETRIIADPEQLKRVINNIVGNSVKYLDKPHGRIVFRLLDEEDSIRVEVEDNGKGIAPRDIPYIFDRFYRTDSSRNSAKGGSGIGLSIVKKIIEDHGGYIWATSTLGEGTCMHIVLRKYQDKMEQEYEDLTY